LYNNNALKNLVFIYDKQFLASCSVSNVPISIKVSVHTVFGTPIMISGGTVAVVVYAFEKYNLYFPTSSFNFSTLSLSTYPTTLFEPPFFPLSCRSSQIRLSYHRPHRTKLQVFFLPH